jgi:hypothetical protein
LPSAVVVLLLLSSGVADLTSEAASSGRPRACPALEAQPGASGRPAQALWQKTSQQHLARFCQRLSSTQITLGTAPADALVAAQALASEWPERSEPRQLVARALTRLGRHSEAWPLWASTMATAEPTGALALHDYALAAAMTGHDEQALSAYRTLVTRTASSVDRALRERILIEASAAALRVDRAGTEEALGYLAAAADDRSTPLLATAAAGLARLTNVLRPGALIDPPPIEPTAAWQLLREVETPTPGRTSWPSLPPHELRGLAALVILPSSADEATTLWRAYIAGLEARGAAGQPALARARAELARMNAGTEP